MMSFIKKSTFILVCSALILWSGLNIRKQYYTLKLAREENTRLRENIGRLENEVLMLNSKLEYSTGSAARERQFREVLGLGKPDDYWIILPKDATESNFKVKLNEDREESNLEKWWKLFF